MAKKTETNPDAGGFEARNMRFVYVDDPSLLNEVLFSKITLKHFIGLLIAAFLGVIALNTGNPIIITMCLAIALLTIACAFYPPKALSLESILIGAILNVLDVITQKGEKKQVVTIKPESTPSREKPQELPQITVKVDVDELIQNEKLDLTEILNYEPLTKRKLREIRARGKDKKEKTRSRDKKTKKTRESRERKEQEKALGEKLKEKLMESIEEFERD